ncbi:EAL domain-containing protein [Oceanisphaera avium]|uniref:GGDEF-domain containing protein n=1 Tax=Oceanisphaera avium TaxID=1903694 RepID=A0A1Y0CYI0_9GAMM|nr:EAL domain-containing protein [Oceanisphaera avium]ART79967.1 hypothetical protein CBP12_07250 [Oceanisphaera avium]
MKRFFASSATFGKQYGHLFAIKFLLSASLLITMIYLGSTASHTLSKIRAHNSLLEQRTYEVPWSLMQLQLEMHRFLDAVRLRHADSISQDEFMLRYDILWSRTPLLLSQKFTRSPGAGPELGLLIRQIDNRIHELEPIVEALTPNSSDYLIILTALSPYLPPLARSVSSLMHQNVRFYAEYDQAYRELGKVLFQRISGFFVTLILLLVLLFRELYRYWGLQQRDPLTGLPNRFALQRLMGHLLERQQPFSVTALEIKNLDSYYQRFGFAVVDKLLKSCSERLKDNLLEHEVLGLPRQNKMFILGKGVVELADIRAQISRLNHALSGKIVIDGYDFYIEPLMGVVLSPSDADNLVDIQARGDLALALCKQEQQAYVFFDPSLIKEMSRRQQLAKDLPAALTSSSLTLELQPLMAWPTAQCVGLQVLTSWHHPHYGVIAPNELLRVTELYQCSESVLLWSLQTICSQLKVWQRHCAQPLFVTLPLPAALFRPGIEATLITVLQDFSLPAHSLVLEISENTLAPDMKKATRLLSRINATGIRVMLTDFGNGSAPIGPLSQLRFDWLKLDSAFCTGIEHAGEARSQLRSLIAIAELLAAKVVCSGVDHASELAALEEMASGLLIQGEAVSELLFATEVTPWLQHLNYR